MLKHNNETEIKIALLILVALSAQGCSIKQFFGRVNSASLEQAPQHRVIGYGTPPDSGGVGGPSGSTGDPGVSGGTGPNYTPPGGGPTPGATSSPLGGGGPTEYPDYNGEFSFPTSSVSDGSVWLVTAGDTHLVYNIKLQKDGSGSYAMKQWNYEDNKILGGTRTYLTGVGLFFSRIPGVLYRVDENSPQDAVVPIIWRPSNATTDPQRGRSCVTAFTTGGVEYLGIAWNNQDKHRVFTRIPVDRSKPNKLDPSRAIDRVYTGDQDTWGYSCYVDSSNRNWFWASYAPWAYQGKNVPIHGVDLNSDSLNELTSEQIPNKNFTSTSLSGAGYSWQGAPIAGNASYSMSGDAGGNILTGSSAYAFTHETKNNLIYSSGHNNGWMTVSKAECYSSTVDCTGKQWGFHLGDLTDNSGATVQSIGPISSLNDGSVVGISRGSVTSVVYLLSPKTAGDPAQGMNFTLIKAVRGDAYMYNDFTGATLYAQTQDKVFDLRKLKGFNPKYPLISTSFSWVSESGMADPWFGLKLEARCFNAQTAASTSLVRVTDIQPAGQSTLVNIPSCRQPGFDQLEVKVTQDGASASFSHATKIRIQATQ